MCDERYCMLFFICNNYVNYFFRRLCSIPCIQQVMDSHADWLIT